MLCASVGQKVALNAVAQKDPFGHFGAVRCAAGDAGVQDEFREKPRYAVPLAPLAALAKTAGVGIFVVGVLEAL